MTRFARGEVISGKYRIERTLAEGSATSVFLARHVDLGQPVAIKLLRADAGTRSAAAERFRLAARAAARLQGAHVCRVLDVDTLPDGAPLVVMEYLEGCQLAQELELHGPLPVAVAVRCVLEACDALGAAHALGIMHCDLKPANLFVATHPDGSRQIKVIGFGVAKAVSGMDPSSAALSVTSSALASPAYMAPEQLEAIDDVDERADVWGLGAVLYELIAGRPAFQGESLPALVSSVLNGRVRPLSEQHLGVPPELDAVLARALRKRRDQRYATVTELVAALLPFVEGEVADSQSDVQVSRSRTGVAAAGSGERTHRGTGPREQQITRGGRARYGAAVAVLLLLGGAGVLAVRYFRTDALASTRPATETVLHGSQESPVLPAPVAPRPAGVAPPTVPLGAAEPQAPHPTSAASATEPLELPFGRSPQQARPVAPARGQGGVAVSARGDVGTGLPTAPRSDKPGLARPDAPAAAAAAPGSNISDFGGRR